MKKALFVFLVCLGICLIFFTYGRVVASSTELDIQQIDGVDPATESGAFSVAAYNIAHARGPIKGTSNWSGDSAEKIDRSRAIGRYLASTGADVVVLNEVDFDATWSGRSDQATIIAEAGNYRYLARQVNFNMRLPGFSLKFGNAILSRYPIKAAERVALPPLSALEAISFGNHDAVQATVALNENTNLEIWGIHLEVRDQATRISAIRDIAEKMAIAAPVVLAGDFNSQMPTDDSRTTAISLLLGDASSGRSLTACETGVTFPTLKPKRRLDWVVYSSELQLMDCHLGDAEFSDHLPILSTFTISGTRGNLQ